MLVKEYKSEVHSVMSDTLQPYELYSPWNSLAFSYDPTEAGNLISGSFAFSKSSLNIWKFSIHVLLKPVLEHFEHHFASMWNEFNCEVI